ncbi:sterile alpha motif domain-containing protein 9-like [Brachyistius frenatus]|uniref:sterile alpha motif domain-containing protein 9-like n=1 Tax=Brachyistius frenatus TaxID=100188 RepID=UPI0037E8D67E
MSDNFNNRGLFGFIQVAKIVFEKLGNDYASVQINLKEEVEAKFEFFEWYLTYSRLDMTSLEPKFFWKDVAECYKHYTGQTAAESTSFPGLLDRLNQGRFISKGRRAGFEEAEITADALQSIRDTLRTSQENNADDVKVAERYILSNIILSNKMPNSPQPTLVHELRAIIFQLLNTEVGRRSPEFYLLVLMLFCPEEQATQEPGLVINIDLQRYVTFMADAFERVGYAKYLRGRYLLPLFFLGKGSGLSKWIHKSRLDAIVEEQVDTELAAEQDRRTEMKMKRISDMWWSGEVWQIPQVQEILLPVQVEPSTNPWEVFIYVGGKKTKAITEAKPDGSALRLYYLGFTIQGPVVF